MKYCCETYGFRPDRCPPKSLWIGAPAQHDILAVCSQLVHGQVYDGAIIYKLYVIMSSSECRSYFAFLVVSTGVDMALKPVLNN